MPPVSHDVLANNMCYKYTLHNVVYVSPYGIIVQAPMRAYYGNLILHVTQYSSTFQLSIIVKGMV